MADVLVVVEHDRGHLAPASLEALTAARTLAGQLDAVVEALVIGDIDEASASEVQRYGAVVVHHASDELWADYGPEAWGEVVAQAYDQAGVDLRVVSVGSSLR